MALENEREELPKARQEAKHQVDPIHHRVREATDCYLSLLLSV
jgi:hypothetical protein